jgi:hypothetical protein
MISLLLLWSFLPKSFHPLSRGRSVHPCAHSHSLPTHRNNFVPLLPRRTTTPPSLKQQIRVGKKGCAMPRFGLEKEQRVRHDCFIRSKLYLPFQNKFNNSIYTEEEIPCSATDVLASICKSFKRTVLRDFFPIYFSSNSLKLISESPIPLNLESFIRK